MNMMSAPSVHRVSECFIKPPCPTEESKQIYYLTPWDIAMLSVHYIQKGLLFKKPQPDFNTQTLLDKLKQSLSVTLSHYYPLVGRLVTHKTQHPPSYAVFVDCRNSSGGRFIHATLDLTVSDILSPVDVPPIVHSLFDHHRAINHDGHTLPLLSIQVTELKDGIFIGCSMSHSLADGTSYWNFFNAWSQIFNDVPISISNQPSLNRWFPEGFDPLINLPFKHQDEFIRRFEAPELRERIFHFSAATITKLKSDANNNNNSSNNTSASESESQSSFKSSKISCFQSLTAHVWRCITRARNLPYDQRTNCKFSANNRSRLEPPLPQGYFGNSMNALVAVATAGELLEHDLAWVARKLHLAIANHSDGVVRRWLEEWLKSPLLYQLGPPFFDTCSVMIGSSPRFNVYGNEFGMGKAVAVRSGYGSKYDGKVTVYPGYEQGSMDLEVCLPPHSMSALESDHEFLNTVSVSS